MAQISYRNLGPNYDPLWGQGQANFLTDLDAVAQAILTRINLFEAEWWANLNDGTPMWQSILGAPASLRQQQQISLLLTQRILGTPYVLSVSNVTLSFNANTRSMSYTATVQTRFGTAVVTNIPTPTPQGIPE